MPPRDDEAPQATLAANLLRHHWHKEESNTVPELPSDERAIDSIARVLRQRRRHRSLARFVGRFIMLIAAAMLAAVFWGE